MPQEIQLGISIMQTQMKSLNNPANLYEYEYEAQYEAQKPAQYELTIYARMNSAYIYRFQNELSTISQLFWILESILSERLEQIMYARLNYE